VLDGGRVRDPDGGGLIVHTFPTGQGNPIGPVIEITGPGAVRTLGEPIDADVSDVLGRAMTIPQARDALIAMVARTASGRIPRQPGIRDDEAVP
jgi:(2R)-sulfolactate sulfo-lyase subunit beta